MIAASTSHVAARTRTTPAGPLRTSRVAAESTASLAVLEHLLVTQLPILPELQG
jgi:hypothetical protein